MTLRFRFDRRIVRFAWGTDSSAPATDARNWSMTCGEPGSHHQIIGLRLFWEAT